MPLSFRSTTLEPHFLGFSNMELNEVTEPYFGRGTAVGGISGGVGVDY